VHDPDLMNVFDSRDDLLIILAGFFLLETLRFSYLFEKLVSTAILHDKKQVLIIFYDLKKD
jgi:hypothetical protein